MVGIVVREKKMCETLKRKYAESCGIFIVLFPGIAVTSPPLKRPAHQIPLVVDLLVSFIST